MKAIIDLDILGYLVAINQYDKLENRTDEEKVKEHINSFISSIITNTESEFYCMFFGKSSGITYRKEFYPEYKANRKHDSKAYHHWKEVIQQYFLDLNAVPLNYIEADDALSIMKYTLPDQELVLCHNDKDMFQCEGHHYLYKIHSKQFITKEEAEYNLYKQILKGDSTDNIPGAYNIGEKKATKILENREFDKVKNYFKTEEEYELNYKLIKLLETDELEPFTPIWIKNDNLITLDNLFDSTDLFE